MKKILVFTSIIVIILAIICIIFANKKADTVQEKQVPAEQIQKVTPKKFKKNVDVEKTPTTRDENDMPKSDFNVPEIG